MKILLIEDDENMVDYIKNLFSIGWPEVDLTHAYQGERGLSLVTEQRPDVILLDLGLPDMSGFDVLRQIRKISSVPVMIITVRGEESDIVKGLNLGADDYVIKPFRQLELLARLRALMRRRKTAEKDLRANCGRLRFGDTLCDVICQDERINITLTEGRILYKLVEQKGKVVKTSEIAEDIWGKYPDNTGYVKTYIYRLRKKLEKDPLNPQIILSKPGIGYFIATENNS